jgi:MFS family permease
MSSFAPQRPGVSSMPSESSLSVPAALARRHGSGFWTVAFAFLIVMAFATLPSPLYGLYRARDHLSAFTVTVVYAIFAAGTIAALLRVRAIAERVGRRGVMLGAVATMMTGAALLAAWKTLPVLLVGRLLTGVAVGLAAGTAITYLIELRVRRDPNVSPARARNIGTSVNVGALGVGPLVAGCLAQWAGFPLTLPYLVFVALGAIALIGLATAPETGAPGPRTTVERQAAGPPAAARIPIPAAAATPPQPSPRAGCSPVCPGCSLPPRSAIPHTPWPARRCSWCIRQG